MVQVYKQKVKHLLAEQQAGMSDAKTDGQQSLKLLQHEERSAKLSVCVCMMCSCVCREKLHELELNVRMLKVRFCCC